LEVRLSGAPDESKSGRIKVGRVPTFEHPAGISKRHWWLSQNPKVSATPFGVCAKINSVDIILIETELPEANNAFNANGV